MNALTFCRNTYWVCWNHVLRAITPLSVIFKNVCPSLLSAPAPTHSDTLLRYLRWSEDRGRPCHIGSVSVAGTSAGAGAALTKQFENKPLVQAAD